MTALVSVRRRNTWLALLAGVVALVSVPVAGLVAGSAITRSSAAVNVGVDEALEIPPTPVGALATALPDGTLTSITAVALAPSGVGGTVVSVPVGSRVRAVGLVEDGLALKGGVRLADVYAAEGIESFARELSGVLNTSLETVEVLAVDDAVTLLSGAGVDPGVLQRLSDALHEPTNTAEVERWSTLGDLWREVVDRTGATAQGIPSVDLQSSRVDLEALTRAVFSGDVAYHQFTVDPVLSTEANPDLLDLVDLDRSEVVLVMASVAPSAVVAANPSLSVQIDSAFDFDVTRRAVASVLFVGANVLLVRPVDDTPSRRTQVLTSVRLSASERQTLETLFGDIEVADAQQRVEGIDVQIRLGMAFAEAEDKAVSTR